MIYPEVKDLGRWLEKYDLEVITYECPKCKRGFKSTVPFLIKGYAGLETPIHECGPQYREIVISPRTDSTEQFWNVVL